MKNMILLSLLYFVAAATAAVRKEVACGVAGAVQCDADHVTTCTQSGAWRSVRDCAATNAVCAGGRCVSKVSTRAATCEIVGARDCSADCEYVTSCSNAHVWVVVNKCGSGTLCVNGECVSNQTNTCRTSSTVVCGQSSAGESFPNLEDCSTFFTCDEEWSSPKINYCGSGYYDPCSGTCSLASPLPCKHYEPCDDLNDGLDVAVSGNPSLHYTCASGSTVLKKCESGYYDASEGECLGTGVVCRSSC